MLFFYKYPRKKGVFYGCSYGYVKYDGKIKLFASLSENNGFTIIRFNVPRSQVVLEKDFDGVVFSGQMPLIRFAALCGKYESVFDEWFRRLGVTCRIREPKCGYTTWYNYYRHIDAQIVEKDLRALSALPQKIDIFQIDDGYQRCVGDWLHADESKFPGGMKVQADKIHAAGMLAGLWLSPFAVSKESFIYKEHRDWLVHDAGGKLYLAGANWGGFYALDFYNANAAAYIRRVFDTVLNDWGYDMVKLDFLYAACLVPRYNKSRGQIMCEAMEFIRECAGEKLVLGCGVPLMPAFGKVDFCRVGADVSRDWAYDKNQIREDVSTPNTVACSVFRRGLNGRAFLNDPDVFLLRDDNINMDFAQRKLLAQINGLFGSLLFVSDDVSRYGPEQLAVFLHTIRKKDVKILKADLRRDNIICVEYTVCGQMQNLVFNYKTGRQVHLAD